MNYALMPAQEDARRQWKFLPSVTFDRYLHGKVYILLHLYSGRRRADDWHAHVQSQLPIQGLEVVVISLDTAVNEQMDINKESLWTKLIHAANDRKIGGILLGPPCESWSGARHATLYSPSGEALRGPRPLRSNQAPWGLAQLSFKELSQIFVGSGLLLKGIWLAILVALTGSVSILEHPAAPYEEDRASIWRTGLLRALTRGSWLMRLCMIFQWKFGATGSEPTTLMYSGVSFPRILAECELPEATKPEAYLIGRQADGSFCTSSAKEYPGALNKGFAMAMLQFLRWADSHQAPNFDMSWAFEFAAQSASIVETSWRPDYQPV